MYVINLDDIDLDKIAARMPFIRARREGYAEGYVIGYAKGLVKSNKQLILGLLKIGADIEQIADILDWPFKKIDALKDQINAIRP